MTQPPSGGYPPPEQNPHGGQPGPAGQPPAAPPAGGPGYPPPGSAPQAPAGPPPQAPAGPPPQGPAGPPPGAAGPPPGAPAGPPPGYAPPAGGYPPPPAGQPGYPPPPAGQPGYPPPGQPAYAGAPGSSNIQFDISKVTTGDWIVMGSGLLLLIFSFFGWLSVDLGPFGSYSVGAWHYYWWIATILGLAVAVIVALRATMGQRLDQIKPEYLVYGAALGFVITLIALIHIFAGFSGAGPGFGIWVCLILSAIQTYVVWLWAQKQPGWTMPKLPGPANF